MFRLFFASILISGRFAFTYEQACLLGGLGSQELLRRVSANKDDEYARDACDIQSLSSNQPCSFGVNSENYSFKARFAVGGWVELIRF